MYTQLLWALFWERVVFGTLPDRKLHGYVFPIES